MGSLRAGPLPGNLRHEAIVCKPSAGLSVLKFGGTSLADVALVRRVAAIVAAQSASGPTVAVVSAFGGVTDDLADAAAWAEQGDARSAEKLEQIRERHRDGAAELVSEGELVAVTEAVEALLDRLEELLQGISLVKECSPRTRDSVLSIGERLSSILVAAALRVQGTDAAPCDAANLILTDANFGRAWVDMEASRSRVLEHSVGAGIPVLRTIEDLVSTGDTIQSIEGVLSGTLSFICDRLMVGTPFSAALREADERGFTEPDPREDLGGRDVARKLVILGRMAGFSLEMDDVEVEPLLPDAPWVTGPLEAFWEKLPEVDAEFDERRAAAVADDTALVYLASVEDGRATVRMTGVPADHACSGLSISENLIAITSRRYAETPLAVRGPGAGPEVTAAGVFADVLRALAESS